MKKLLRRLCIPVVCILLSSQAWSQTAVEVELKWLDTMKFLQPIGVSWGVPWGKGLVRKNQSFTLTSADGKLTPVQSWPLAYWPDGSVKWTGFASVPGTVQGSFKLTVNKGTEVPSKLLFRVTESSK